MKAAFTGEVVEKHEALFLKGWPGLKWALCVEPGGLQQWQQQQLVSQNSNQSPFAQQCDAKVACWCQLANVGS